MFRIDKVNYKLVPGNIYTHHVTMYKRCTGNGNKTLYHTMPIYDSSKKGINAMIVCSNPTIATYMKETLGPEYQPDYVPLFVPRHIAQVLTMPLVTLINTHCNIRTKLQEWDVHFYTPPHLTIQEFRVKMLDNVDVEP
jgi:hypothetical protein